MKSLNDGDYELVQAVEADSSPGSLTDDRPTKLTLALPPKLLPPREGRAFAQSLVATYFTITLLVALSMLISQMWRLSPDLEPHNGRINWFDWYTPNKSSSYSPNIGRVPASDISCDLVSTNASAFEKIFTIDLRSQSQLSFAQAKFIDVVWDLLIGQGGRLLLVWISYIVFMDGLARLIETSPVSYNLYAAIVFDTSSLTATWYALKAVSTGRGWRGRAFFAWFGIATIYVLGYSTLMSAATGYINPSDARYKMTDGGLIKPDSEDIKHCIVLSTGSQVGFPDNHLILGPSDQDLDRHMHLDEFQSSFGDFYSLAFGKFLSKTSSVSSHNRY